MCGVMAWSHGMESWTEGVMCGVMARSHGRRESCVESWHGVMDGMAWSHDGVMAWSHGMESWMAWTESWHGVMDGMDGT